MKKLKEYIINFGNLKPGKHEYDFSAGEDFFEAFEYSLVKKGKVDIHVTLDKQKETFFILNFALEGHIGLECDRCLDEFSYPVKGNYRMLVKLDAKEEESDDDELIFLAADAYELDVSPYIYEYINLSIPLKISCDEIGKDCNPKMLSVLNKVNDHSGENGEIDPRWEGLKDLKKNKK